MLYQNIEQARKDLQEAEDWLDKCEDSTCHMHVIRSAESAVEIFEGDLQNALDALTEYHQEQRMDMVKWSVVILLAFTALLVLTGCTETQVPTNNEVAEQPINITGVY